MVEAVVDDYDSDFKPKTSSLVGMQSYQVGTGICTKCCAIGNRGKFTYHISGKPYFF